MMTKIKSIFKKYWTPEMKTFLIMNMADINYSLSSAFPGIIISQLQDSTFTNRKPITPVQASHIASLGVIPACISALSAGFVSNAYGRKRAVMFFYIISFTGWLSYYFARTITEIYVSRVISGFATGFAGVVYQHIAEMTAPSRRGTMLTVCSAICSFGYVIANYLSRYDYHIICAVYSVYCLISCASHQLFVLESPTWLVIKNHIDKARHTLRKLRGNDEEAEVQLQDMINLVGQKTENGKPSPSQLKMWKQKKVYKPFLIILVYLIFQQTNGTTIINYFPICFFQAFKTPINARNVAVFFSCLRFTMCLIIPVLVHNFRRRPMGMVSSLLMCFIMSMLAIWQQYFSKEFNSNHIFMWVPVVLIALHIVSASCGSSFMPWMMASEILSQKTRAYQSGILNAWSYVLLFAVSKTFFIVLPNINLVFIILCFSIVPFVCFIFVLLFLPETFKKSLVDIEKGFETLK